MLHYVLQTVVFQLFFLMIYDLFLKQETFFNWNRCYLLSSTVLSIVLPFVKLKSFETVIPQDYFISLSEIVIGNSENNNGQQIVTSGVNAIQTSINIWEIILYFGWAFTTLFFLYKLAHILLLVFKNPKIKIKKAFLIKLRDSKSAFSFFNYIFLGEQIVGDEKEIVLAHEQIHVKEKHSLDLLLFEALRIAFWFNPLIYVYQDRVANIHEYIADSKAVKQNKVAYYQNLLAQVFQTKRISFINPFFKKSLIKKRIIMLNKTKSRQINLVKYALLIPVVLGMLMYTSCSSDNATSVIDVAEESNLQQYSYTVEKEVEITEDAKRIQKNAENFLKANNKDYVYWGIRDNVTGGANYFVRKATEKDPDGINKIELTFKDGGFFIMFLEKGLYPTHLDNIEKMNSFPSSKSLLAEKGWVSFNRIDTVPVFPGCESLTNNEGGKTCFQEGISNLFLKHFNRKIGKEAGLKGDVKIYVFFVISKEGEIIEVNARAPHDKLVDEALRVMSYAPKMIPGEENGEKVNVAYYIPVKFTINE